MISIKPRSTGWLVMPAALLLAVPALAGPLVVRAMGPSAASFKAGQRLPDSTPLTLKAGDQITILDARGTRNLSGPGSFRLDQSSAVATQTGFNELLTQKTERRARIGAVRSVGGTVNGKPVPPGVWAIDAGTSATVCVLDASKLSLWRADPTAVGTITVARATGGASAPVAFAAGQAVAAWPTAIAVADGDRFNTKGAGAPASLTIRKLAAAPAAIDELGAAFLAAGCQSQFDRLTTVTKLADAPAS